MGILPEIAVDRLVADRAKLLAYIWSLVHDFHAAEDIFPETLLAAMSHAGDMKDEAHLLAWARQTARFRAVDWLRREGRQPFLLDDDVLDLLEGQWSRFDGVSTRDWIDALRLCVAKLTEYARSLINLRFVEGLTGLEVARRLGRTPKTVYVALSRTYRQLEDCIQEQLEPRGSEPSNHDSAGKR